MGGGVTDILESAVSCWNILGISKFYLLLSYSRCVHVCACVRARVCTRVGLLTLSLAYFCYVLYLLLWCVCVLHVCLCVCMCMWRSEDNLGFCSLGGFCLIFLLQTVLLIGLECAEPASWIACETWEHSSCRLWSTRLQMCATSLHVFLGLELRFSRLSGKLYTS